MRLFYDDGVARGAVVAGGAGVGGIGTVVGFGPHGLAAPPKHGTYSGGMGGAANVGSVIRPSYGGKVIIKHPHPPYPHRHVHPLSSSVRRLLINKITKNSIVASNSAEAITNLFILAKLGWVTILNLHILNCTGIYLACDHSVSSTSFLVRTKLPASSPPLTRVRVV